MLLALEHQLAGSADPTLLYGWLGHSIYFLSMHGCNFIPPAALGGNFLGVTSTLLALDGGKLAASTNLDVLVPVNGSRRCLDTGNGFTLLYPAKWLADQTLYRRYAERIEREAALDPPSLRRERARRQGVPEPAAAFGPAGSTGGGCNAGLF